MGLQFHISFWKAKTTFKMKAFVAVFAGIAAASAAPKADPGLLLPVLLDPHASTGETVEHPNGAVVPDDTNAVKLARAGHLTAKALAGPHLYGYGLPAYGYHYGKREAEAKAEPWLGYGVYGGYGAVVPTVGLAKTGLIYTPPGAITPDYTDAQKEAGLGEGTHDIKVPVVTGAHVLYGKREAEADPWLYGHGLYGGLYAPSYVVPKIGSLDTGLIVSPASGAVTPDFTDEQKEGGLGEGTHAIKVPVITGHKVVVGKREAEADPSLVVHPNGAVTPPYTYAQQVAAAQHFAAKGYGLFHHGYLYGKRSADADAHYYGLGYHYPAYTTGY